LWPRLLHFLWTFVAARITWKRAIVTLFAFPIAFYLYTEVFAYDVLVIEPFSVPRRFEEIGLNSEAMGRRIGDALSDIETQGNSILKQKDRLAFASDPNSVPAIEVPGTGLGLRTIVDATRQVFRREPKRVRGEIYLPLNAPTNPNQATAEIALRIVEGGSGGVLLRTTAPAADLSAIVQNAAETILRHTNPMLLAVFLEGEARNYDEIVQIAEEIVSNPSAGKREFAKAHVLWGLALADQDRTAEAFLHYAKAAQVDPKLAATHNTWGLALADQEKYQDAIAHYQEALRLDPKFAFAQNSWGLALAAQENYGQAIAHYQKAAQLDPRYGVPYNNWGLALASQKKYAEAVSQYERAAQILDSRRSTATGAPLAPTRGSSMRPFHTIERPFFSTPSLQLRTTTGVATSQTRSITTKLSRTTKRRYDSIQNPRLLISIGARLCQPNTSTPEPYRTSKEPRSSIRSWPPRSTIGALHSTPKAMLPRPSRAS
jgi:tetratricopeptide (TPR) repeat protein